MYSYIVSLRFFHPTLSPDLVADQLQLTASASWTAGEPRQTPKGTLIGGIRQESYAAFRIADGDDGQLPEALMAALGQLHPHGEFLAMFKQTGGEIAFFVSWHVDGDAGMTLDASLLAEIATLGIDLGINILS